MNKYTQYNYKDFLLDDDFIKWQLLPSDKKDAFWHELITQHPHLKEEIEKAIFLFKTKLKSGQSSPLNQEEQAEIYSKLKENIERTKLDNKKSKRRHIYAWFTAASVAAIAFLVFQFDNFTNRDLNDKSLFTEEVNVDFSSKNITLASGDSIIELDNNSNIQHQNDIISISNATADEVQAKVNETERNILVVPYGKRSTLILPDGTKVWVNSATTVQYPSNFAAAKREIYVDGEVFLDVTKDPKRPFIVHSKSHQVKVLGTKFGFCTYTENYEGYVVLVEGSVDVEGQLIKPNQMIRLMSPDKNDFSIEYVNTDLYTAWINGWLHLESENVPNLCKRLSRYYGVNIIADESLNNEKMTGKLILQDDINKVLNTISQNLGVEYVQNSNEAIKFLSKK